MASVSPNSEPVIHNHHIFNGTINTSYLVCAFLFLFLYRIFAGYFAARLYKTCKGQNWKKSALLVICNFLIDDQHAHLLFFDMDAATMFALDF